MPSLTADGRHFGHRVYTQRSSAAPGLVWSAFDELMHDEPQAMWTAVLLWRDVLVVLTTVRPTLPVAVYHAPAPLGVERPAAIIRRSDPAAGWEYAEGEGRAVAIARLLGYDAQQPSAPFLGRSTNNVAYPYSEHPLVYEAQPSLESRALVSLVLARPTPFDPAAAFAGFTVTETDGQFTITSPDGAQALVVLGGRLPGRHTLGGVTFHGDLRYARALPGGGGCAGQGVERVNGVVTFDAPATFQLERRADGYTYFTTDTGAALAPVWLGPPTVVEARLLSGAWEAVPECTDGDLPTLVVRAWQQRNGRQLVDFRFR